MKPENASAKRFLQDGLLVYSSGTLHHQKSGIRGYLFKKAAQKSFFRATVHYVKRYFIITGKTSFIQIQEQPVSKHYKRIPRDEIVCVQNISRATAHPSTQTKDCPWKFYFELKTTQRVFQLHAPTAEERDLWVNGLQRLLQIQVTDPSFVPMGPVNKTALQLHEHIQLTEGNNNQDFINNSQLRQNNKSAVQQNNSRQSSHERPPSNKPPIAMPVKSSTPQNNSGKKLEIGEGEQTDELNTINMIENLHPESKKLLNSLVQSVIVTQQDNEKEKLEVLAYRRKLIQAQQMLEQEKLDFQRQKLVLSKLIKKNEISNNLNAQSNPADQPKKRRRTVSVKRYRVLKDGSKIEVPSTPLNKTTGFVFKTQERKVCLTPEGKKRVTLVRSISRQKRNSVEVNSPQSGEISIIQPLDLNQQLQIQIPGYLPKAPQNVNFKIQLQTESFVERLGKK